MGGCRDATQCAGDADGREYDEQHYRDEKPGGIHVDNLMVQNSSIGEAFADRLSDCVVCRGGATSEDEIIAAR